MAEFEDENGKKWFTIGPLTIEVPKPDASVEELNRIIGIAINDMRPLMPQGIPEVGLPACEPFILSEIVFERRAIGGLVAVNSHSRDLQFNGMSSFVNDKFILDPKARQLKFSLDVPDIHLACGYIMGGSILFIPVNGQGHFTASADGVHASGVALLEICDERVQVESVQIQLEVNGRIRCEIKGLFKDNSWLESLINTLINQHWERLYRELKPELETKLEEIVIAIANASLGSLPFLVHFLQ